MLIAGCEAPTFNFTKQEKRPLTRDKRDPAVHVHVHVAVFAMCGEWWLVRYRYCY